jgi:hypothetical protein
MWPSTEVHGTASQDRIHSLLYPPSSAVSSSDYDLLFTTTPARSALLVLQHVAKLRKQGKSEVGEYYAAYAAAKQWAYAAGVVDGRAAMLVYDREISLGTPAYFVALDFDGDRVVSIHDFLYARYAMDGVDLSPLNPKAPSQ